MTRLIRTLVGVLLVGVVLASCGCGPRGASATSRAESGSDAGGVQASPTVSDTFQAPAPAGATDDPRVAAAAASSTAIALSLEIIHQRLSEVKAAYDTKAQTEVDLRAVAERMKPLLEAAREDCDLVMRAAKDVRTQLPYAASGYAHAAASYRQRAEGYSDPDLKTLTLQIADEFDRVAADVPRRLELTETFIVELGKVQEFLAETDRCLRDTATALSLFSAGKEEPQTSFGGKVFRKRLEQFIAIVFEYQEKLSAKPSRVIRDAESAPTTPQTPAVFMDLPMDSIEFPVSRQSFREHPTGLSNQGPEPFVPGPPGTLSSPPSGE